MNCGLPMADCGSSTSSRRAWKWRQFAIRHPRSAIMCFLMGALFAVAPPQPASAAPLTLDDAVRLERQRNQALKVSAFTPDIARANGLTEYGRFDPALAFPRSYSEGQSPVVITPLVQSLTQ